ncbi:AIR synthase [Sulfolobus sp. S-194]|uniref:AIR synthase-related protein n=1 Tax=Sulfolobus sp. S-194 TaxID=2512240 RepID=UPI001436E26C|nr:AIR synthase-related protein [Sulfolobus sp. S-194]QIW24868.1 AIR synthase [Sulfolobus sp. S-194]
MDLEGIARKLYPDKDEIRRKLTEEIEFYKGKNYPLKEKIVEAIIKEVEKSINIKGELFEFPRTNIKAGDAGLGSRGIGDHIIHNKILKIANLEGYEDARINKGIIASIDGIHSRLAYFPFLAAFHATKAALRDIMVKGAEPIGVIVDIHLSDDSDVGMLLDFEAGVSTVTEALNIPILSGSTLRIGGDMVIGERISGGIGAIGIVKNKYFSRKNVAEGQYIVMTEGNGGGTITTTAIYNGFYDVMYETLNIKDLVSCEISSSELSEFIHTMTDVTNGGIRASALEISENNVTLRIDKNLFLSLINQKVLSMLQNLRVDPFGISIDSILIFTDNPELVKNKLNSAGVRAEIIGKVTKYKGYPIIDETDSPLKPMFRESPYTPIKQVIGNYSPYTEDYIEKNLELATQIAKAKKEKVLKTLKGS